MKAPVLLAGVLAFAALAAGAYLLLAGTSSGGSSMLTSCGHAGVSSRDFEDVAPTIERAVAKGEVVDVPIPSGRHKLMVSAEGGVLEQLPRAPPGARMAMAPDGCPADAGSLRFAATADLTMRVYVRSG